jgi:hypothetical protein
MNFNKYQWLRRFNLWLSQDSLIATVILYVILLACIFVALLVMDNSGACAHDIHFSNVNLNGDRPILRKGQDIEGRHFFCYEDGNCWVLYKDGDLTHMELHVINTNNRISVKGEDQEK